MNNFYHGQYNERPIFTKKTAMGEKRDYSLYRIPGIVVTQKGTVIVYCEARTDIKNRKFDTFHTDYNLMDIIMKRSTDGGETFSESIYLASGNNEPGGYACVGNPVMVVDNDNVIHFLYSRDLSVDGGGLWHRKSYDDGLTWTEAKELGNFADELGHEYNAFVFGPTHGICTADGTLVVSVWEVERREHNPLLDVYKRDDEFLLGTHIFYSTDGGDSWHITKEFCFDKETFAGELSLALLSDKRSI